MHLCNFPTTVVFVDDSLNYIEAIQEILSNLNIITKTVKNTDVVNFLNKHSNKLHLEKIGIKKKADSFDSVIINCDVSKLYKMIYNADRFNVVSVLIIDQVMPNIMGEEILELVHNLSIKKMLLTGLVGNDAAINMLNRNLIDSFLSKDNANFNLIFYENVSKLLRRFFLDEFSYEYTVHEFLKNPFLCELIRKLLEKYNPIEYYILDDSGSCLFLDEYANPSCLIVYKEKEIEDFITFLREESVPEDRYSKLLNKSHIIGVYYKNQYSVDLNFLLEQIIPAKIISGPSGENIYYAFVQGSQVFPIDTKRVVSFDDFCKKIKKKN